MSGCDIRILTGNAHPLLAQNIAKEANSRLCASQTGAFSDGEISVNIDETVRGMDVFVIQPTCAPVNNHLMELLILIDALKRASAGRITAVIPYYGYARQDRKVKARDPITAKLVADLITAAGADRILTMDLHAAQIQGYFNIPVDHLQGGPILAQYFLEHPVQDLVVVSPDLGSVARARTFADFLDAPIAIIDKRRPKANVSEVMNIIGDIQDKNVIIIDDMIDTAGTLTNAAKALQDFGAKDIYACCTHPVLSGPALERLQDSCIKQVVVLDTMPIPDLQQCPKIVVQSVAPIFGAAIRKIFENDSVSKLFSNQKKSPTN